MSNFTPAQIINDYLRTKDDIFTLDEFYKYLKSSGVKISKVQAEDLLHSSDLVFSLVQKEFITRAGVFSGRVFSFKPTKEEVEKGHFLIGHRCIPFISNEISPDSITVISKADVVESEETVFSMNLAFDTFALYGEGYVIPYVFNDKANTEYPLASVQYSLPQEIKLTSWPLNKLDGGEDFTYGDRVICKIINWDECMVDMRVLKDEKTHLQVSEAAIQREEWYTHFENGLLESFDRNGPGNSIEEQLALLFLENQEKLCIRNCGSCEEFLKHTKKIGFSAYGVETRIWRNGENVPYIGEWNKDFEKDLILSDISMTFTPQVIDAYLENDIYESKTNPKYELNLKLLSNTIFPQSLKMSAAERDMVLLNIEKRRDILKQKYIQFSDYKVAQIRKRILGLFSQVSALICDIAGSGIRATEFPQQELVILSQLFAHIVRLLEEVENQFLRDQFPVDDVALSLDGMEDTFEGICGTLKSSLERNRRKGFEIIN